MPPPTNIDELRSYLRMVSYYRWLIPSCSTIAFPIHQLLKKGQKFKWYSNCENAFQQLKVSLSIAPLLKLPAFNLPFLIQTDASNKGKGARLVQNVNNENHPIAYVNRSLTKAEVNYSTSEKEALSLIWSLQTFRPYILNFKVIIETDPPSLVGLFKKQI